MTAPISVQLYSLREASEADFDAVLTRLAEIGYAGVEPFALFGMTPVGFRRRVEELGMRVSSSHYPWANRAEPAEVCDIVGELGLTRAAGGFAPDDFQDLDAVRRTADTVNGLVESLGRGGDRSLPAQPLVGVLRSGGRPSLPRAAGAVSRRPVRDRHLLGGELRGLRPGRRGRARPGTVRRCCTSRTGR